MLRLQWVDRIQLDSGEEYCHLLCSFVVLVLDLDSRFNKNGPSVGVETKDPLAKWSVMRNRLTAQT